MTADESVGRKLFSLDLGALGRATRSADEWVRMRTRVQHTLQSLALANGLRRGATLWSQAGRHALQTLPMAPYAGPRRDALLTLYPRLQESIDKLDQQVSEADARSVLTFLIRKR